MNATQREKLNSYRRDANNHSFFVRVTSDEKSFILGELESLGMKQSWAVTAAIDMLGEFDGETFERDDTALRNKHIRFNTSEKCFNKLKRYSEENNTTYSKVVLDLIWWVISDN